MLNYNKPYVLHQRLQQVFYDWKNKVSKSNDILVRIDKRSK
jgi:hypothetical protein